MLVPILEVREVNEILQGHCMVEFLANLADESTAKFWCNGASENLASHANRILHCLKRLHMWGPTPELSRAVYGVGLDE